MFTSERMSPRAFATPAPESAAAGLRRVWVALGSAVRDARLARKWSVRSLAAKAGVSPVVAYRVEAGQPTTLAAVVRMTSAPGLRLDVALADPRRRIESRAQLSSDMVHSAMGELEASHLRRFGYLVGIDEPYQHFQFAGRADIVAWDKARAALLHLENRTRFPDFQDMAGSFNSKRAYLGRALAERVGVRRWASETHVIAALWSSEVVHALWMRTESFRSLCPAGTEALDGWWRGDAPASGITSALVVLDPLATTRQRPFIGLEEALVARPRHGGYAEVAARLGATVGVRHTSR